MRGFFAELARRRVYRTTAYYLAGAWLTIEVSATIFPMIDGMPEWAPKAVLVLAVVGLPVALILAWFFDLEPKIVRTEPAEVDGEGSASSLPTPHKNSIAVLPFVNMSQDPDNEFFSDGISEELLNLLSKQSGLKVAARTSSFAFKKKQTDIPTIAKRLGVRTVLEGSVRRAENRVRISGQLVEASTGYQLWSETFDMVLEDIFAIQDHIASAIVEALKGSLGLGEKTGPALSDHPPTTSVEAYQHFLRGRYLWERRGETAIRGAITALEKAIELDSEFAKAYSALSAARAVLHEYSGEQREIDFAIAEPLAHQAIALDPTLDEPHAVLGYINMRRWNWAESEAEFIRALSMEPNDPLPHHWFSNLLNDLGRHDEALSEALKAYELDRVSPMTNNVLAFNYALIGDDGLALKHITIAREFGVGGLIPDYVDFFRQLRSGDYEAAIDTWEKSLKRYNKDASWVRPVVEAFADPSKLDVALATLADAQHEDRISGHALFVQYILLGQADLVFDFADQKLADHSLVHTWLFGFEAKPLRGHPRFLTLMQSMGLVDYWNKNGWPISLTELRSRSA